MGNGISIATKLEKWQRELWVKSKTREHIGLLIRREFEKGNLTESEYREAIREVYTSLR